jgi:hypothetical protein
MIGAWGVLGADAQGVQLLDVDIEHKGSSSYANVYVQI